MAVSKRQSVPQRAPEMVESPLAPELFANEAALFSSGPGVVTITFVSWRFDHSIDPPQRRRVVVGRVVMPNPGAQGLAAGLANFLQKNGIDRASSSAIPQQPNLQQAAPQQPVPQAGPKVGAKHAR